MIFLELLLRQWRQRPLRNFLTLLSISTAVAAVLATSVAQTSVRTSARKLTNLVEGRPALDIIASGGGRFSQSDLPQLEGPEIAFDGEPLVTRATAGRANGKPIRMLLIGVSPAPSPVWDAIPLTAGEPCKAENETVISDETAASLKLDVGDEMTVLTRAGPRTAVVVGRTPAAVLHELAPGASQVMPIATVQKWFRLNDQIDRYRLFLKSTDDRRPLESSLALKLPETLSTQRPGERAELIDSVLRSTELALRFAGALSLALAGFIVLNTLRMNFGERRKQLATLRVIGATTGQMVRLHLFEGFALGVLGTAIGIPLGYLFGQGLTEVMQNIVGEDVPSGGVPWTTLVRAIVMGPLSATIAALVPALLARGIVPAEALGDQEVRRAERFPRWAVISAVVLWLITAAILAMVVFETITPEASMPAGVVMLIAFITILPAVLPPFIRWASGWMSALLGIEANLAAGQLTRRPTRTGLTVGLLVVVLSNGLGLGNAVMNNVDDIHQWQARSLSGDFLIQDPTADDPSAVNRPEIGEELRSLPEVKSVVEIRMLTARASGTAALCIVRDFPESAPLPWALSESEDQDVRAALARGETVASGVLAKKLDAKIGDEIQIEVQGRQFTAKIAAIVNEYNLGGMVAFLDRAAVAKENAFDPGPARMYIVRTTSDEAREAASPKIKDLVDRQALSLQSFADLRARIDRVIGGVVGALWLLLAVGFVVGGIGMGNTLTMSVLEQTRELGLLRIIGMTRGQVYKLVLCEALYFALAAGILGVVAGTTTAYVIHLVNGPLMGREIPFVFQPELAAINAALCFIVAIISTAVPGWRVAKIDLLEAMAYE